MDRTVADTNLDWSNERILPAFPRVERFTIYDIQRAPREVQLSVSALVGLINRTQPHIYLVCRNNDNFWAKELLAGITLDWSTAVNAEIVRELVTSYRESIQGLIIYDPALPDTVNVATMLAGLRDGLIVTPQQAEIFEQAPYELPILEDLRTYGWRSRLEVYQWAYKNLRPLCSTRMVAGMDPNVTTGIRPFLVATKSFIYWLNPLGFKPEPAHGWQSEHGLMRQILRSYGPDSVHLGWFVQEGSGVTITSEYAIPVICTDYFANLETWSGFRPEVAESVSKPEPQLPTLGKKVYLSFTLSEGDNLQYVQGRMLDIWRQAERGTLPVGWPVSLVLPQAAPAMWEYLQRTATPNDEFIAAPSGVAYLYPAKWSDEQLAPLLVRTGQLMQQMNLKLLQILDSNYWLHPRLIYRAIKMGAGMALIEPKLQLRFAKDLQQFGVEGILSGGGQQQVSWKDVAGLLIYQNAGTARNVEEAVSMVRRATPQGKRPYFINLYALAWNLGPKELKQVVEQLGSDYEVVLPSTLLKLLT